MNDEQDTMTPDWPAVRYDERFRHLMQKAGVETIRGVELLRAVRIVNNLYDAIFSERLRDDQLSGPRWGILMRLYADEMSGHSGGLSPSVLSQHQMVSKNTVSALLRGLEEQGLIERQLDPNDRRSFTIRLTDLARAQVRAKTPTHVHFLNRLCADLSETEAETLLQLLARLRQSLLAFAGPEACRRAAPAAADQPSSSAINQNE